MKKALFYLLAVTVVCLAGCADENADYEQKVDLTPEQQAQADKNMEGQKPPGTVDSGQPSGLPMPAGKSGS